MATTAQTAANAAAGATAAATTVAVEAESAAFLGLSYAALGVFAAAAAAGYAVISTSTKIREQAEKRLVNENLISGAINKQVLGLQEAFKEYEKFKRSLEKEESFSNRLSSAVNTSDASAVTRERERIDAANKSRTEEINRLQADLAQKERSLEFAKSRNVNQGYFAAIGVTPEYTAGQKQQDVSQAENAVEKTRKLLAENENLLRKGETAFQQTGKALIDIGERQNKAFSDRFEIFQKSQKDSQKFQESAIELEKRRRAEFEKSVEKGKEKVKELGQTYKSVFSDLTVKTNADNPFVSVFAEARTELDKLKESIKGLPIEMQNAAIASQQAINRNKIFETRIDNALSVFDLRETADKFRNPNRAEENKRFFESAVQSDIRRGNFFPNLGGSHGSFISNQAGGFDKLTDAQKRDIYNVNQLKNLTDFNNPFANVNDRSLFSRLAREQVNSFSGENLSISERLQKQFNIINSNVTNEAERAIADKKILGIGSTLDPSQINQSDREKIAAAAEREAERREKFEEKSFQLREKEIQTQEKLIEALDGLTKIANEKGVEGLNDYLKISLEDKRSTGDSGSQLTVKNN